MYFLNLFNYCSDKYKMLFIKIDHKNGKNMFSKSVPIKIITLGILVKCIFNYLTVYYYYLVTSYPLHRPLTDREKGNYID